MAVRTKQAPDGVGPPPSSPWQQTWLDTISVPGTTQTLMVRIPYNASKVLTGPIITQRDAGCRWTRLVLSPSTPQQLVIPIAAGAGALVLQDLGVSALDALETGGYTVM